MADYATLKAAIQAVIYENGNQEITGSVMQATLLAMVNSLGANYQYAGIATPSTNPGTPDQNVFYLASTAGTYVNFGNIVLAENEVAFLKYNGEWSKDGGLASSVQVGKLNNILTEIAQTQTVSVLEDTTGITPTNQVIGANGMPSSSAQYRMVAIPIQEDTQIFFTAEDKTPFPSFLAISALLPDNTYIRRKRYIRNTEDYLPTQNDPLLLSAGSTLYINAQASQYDTAGKFTYHIVGTSTTLKPAKVLEISKNDCYIVREVTGQGQELLRIFIPQVKGFLEYDFSHSINSSINLNMWLIRNAYIADDNFGQIKPISSTGNWELAIKLLGRSDNAGGIAHGSEVLQQIEFILDGNVISPSELTTITRFRELRILQSTTLYDPADEVTAFATHTMEYVFTPDGLKVKQSVLWLVNESLGESYLAMFPVLQTMSTKYCCDRDFSIVQSPSGGVSNRAISGTKQLILWDATNKIVSEFGIREWTGFITPERALITNNGTTVYNKCYFYNTLPSGGTTVANGDIWKTEHYYKISLTN